MIRALLAMLAGLALVGVLLFALLLDRYGDALRLRLDPAGEQVFANEPLPVRIPETRLVLLYGDSRIAEWDPLPEVPGYQFVNRGVAGQTTGQLLLRLEQDVLDTGADLLLLQAGINDLKAIGLWPEQRAELTAATLDNLLRLLEEVASRGIVPVVMPVLPVGEVPLYRWPVWSAEVEPAVAALNRELAAGAQAAGWLVFDPFRQLSDADSLPLADVYRDELHLSAGGYKKLGAALERYLAEQSLIQRPRGSGDAAASRIPVER